MKYSVKTRDFSISKKRNKLLTQQQIDEDFEYYEGDPWPLSFFAERARGVTDKIEADLLEVLQIYFQSNNILKQCVDRHLHGLLGQDPIYFFADEEGKALETVPQELDKQLKEFLEEYESISFSMANQDTRTAIEKAISDSKICGLGYVRLFDPQYLNIKVSMHSPDYSQVFISRDGNGFPRWACYYYVNDEDEEEMTELQYVNPESNLTEFYIVRGSVSESIRAYKSSRRFLSFDKLLEMIEGRIEESWALDLDGHFTLFEFKLNKLIDVHTKSLQKGINYNLTLMLQYLGAFQQLKILNGLPPGEYQLDPDSQELVYQFPPEVELVPNLVEYIQGLCYMDEDGRVSGYTNPTVVPPLPPNISHFVEALNLLELLLYRAMNQGHVPTENSTQMSGKSRTLMRSSYIAGLEKDSLYTQQRIADIYKTALLLKNIEEQEGINAIKKAKLVVNMNISVGDPAPEEQQQIRDNYQAGLISLESAIGKLGMNPMDELPLIEEEREKFEELLPDPFGESSTFRQQPQQSNRPQQSNTNGQKATK
ncbi:hypothetical protein [Moorena sp. SIO3A2]|uniref:hypothetical protein n=1 Tax=Moorena sp. SIO3A2 TaxID=2607841 RepID=UPI0013BCABF7|nr:hypothetical protein [Moorena sp. SIO3A2]NER90365.1 hypothetical protein [Moorena sp. SIO3A2]